MGEPIWCDIHIKGPSSWGTKPWFFEQLSDLTCNGEADISPSNPNALEWHAHGELNYGVTGCSEAMEILDRLVELKVPYSWSSDAKWSEFPGEWCHFDGTTMRWGSTSGDDAAMSRCEWQAITDGSHKWATSIDEYFEAACWSIDDPERFPISHLPAECPPQDEEESNA